MSTALALPEVAALQARLRPNAVAIECEGRQTTYARLDARARAVAHALLELGVRPGDRVCGLMTNTEQVFEVVLGAVQARTCYAPLNLRLAPAEIAKVIDDARPRVLFVAPPLAELADQALTMAAHGPIRVDLDDGYEALLASVDADAPLPRWAPEDDVIQLYTSGTTGLPKGVRHSNRGYASMIAFRERIEGFAYTESDVVLVVMPLFHVAGLNSGVLSFAGGGKLVILPEFDPAATLAAIGAHRVTTTLLAPVMIQRCLESPNLGEVDLASLRMIVYGASPISESVLARARQAFGCGFLQLYGMSELAGPATVLEPGDHDAPGRLRSAGRPWPGMEVKVCGPEGEALPPGRIGEVLVRGPMMEGYFGLPEATAQAIRDGWLHTGDAGYFDEAGFLFIHDRVKDMIVSGGENIYPAEVENALSGCPGVADVAVIGTPSAQWGEQVTAMVVPVEGSPPDAKAIGDWARQRIAGYKCPKRIEFVTAIPRNASGKILRRELRAPFWSGRERQVG